MIIESDLSSVLKFFFVFIAKLSFILKHKVDMSFVCYFKMKNDSYLLIKNDMLRLKEKKLNTLDVVKYESLRI